MRSARRASSTRSWSVRRLDRPRTLAGNPAVAACSAEPGDPWSGSAGALRHRRQVVSGCQVGIDRSEPVRHPRDPQANPEALTTINAAAGEPLRRGTGAGVTVATIADGLDTTNPDFQRNAAYASAGSAASPVVTQVDFTGDSAATPTAAARRSSTPDRSSPRATQTYDLSKYIDSRHPLPKGCDIKIVGAAPGANVLGAEGVLGRTTPPPRRTSSRRSTTRSITA